MSCHGDLFIELLYFFHCSASRTANKPSSVSLIDAHFGFIDDNAGFLSISMTVLINGP